MHTLQQHDDYNIYLKAAEYVVAISLLHIAEPPTITTHPEDSRGAVPGKPVTFTVQVTGTEPLSYQWQQKLNIIGEWQACSSVEGFDSATLTIASVQQLNKGSYRCVVSNNAGRQASKPAILEVR